MSLRVRASGYGWPAAVGLVALGLCAGLAIRHLVVQAPELAWACGGASPPWWCGLREALIFVLRWQGMGLVAVAAGALALLAVPRLNVPTLNCAGIALAAGAAGLLLYAPELSAAGVLLGSLRLLRP